MSLNATPVTSVSCLSVAVIRSKHYNCQFTFSPTFLIPVSVSIANPSLENTHTPTHTHNLSSSAIRAINQSWLQAKMESRSDGYILCSPGSICLAASDNVVRLFVCKHIVPITLIQRAKHEMTAEAARGAFCLQHESTTDKAGGDFSRDEEPLHLSFLTFSIFINREPIGAEVYFIRTKSEQLLPYYKPITQ